MLDQGCARKRGSGKKVRGDGCLADQMLKVLFGEGQLPLLLERVGAVGMSFELLGKEPAHGRRMRMELEEDAGTSVAAKCVVTVVAVAEEAGLGACSKAAGGAAEIGIVRTGDAAT